MGTRTDHKDKADHNQDFLASIDQTIFPDWTVTVCFCKALHLVEMVFAISGQHSDNHRERHDTLKRDHPQIWMHYLPLYSQSRRARYKVRNIDQKTVDYVKKRLSNVEQMTSHARQD